MHNFNPMYTRLDNPIIGHLVSCARGELVGLPSAIVKPRIFQTRRDNTVDEMEVLKLHGQGVPFRIIGRTLGMHSERVKRIIVRNGERPISMVNNNFPELCKKVWELEDQGMANNEIARQLSASTSAVFRARKKRRECTE